MECRGTCRVEFLDQDSCEQFEIVAVAELGKVQRWMRHMTKVAGRNVWVRVASAIFNRT